MSATVVHIKSSASWEYQTDRFSKTDPFTQTLDESIIPFDYAFVAPYKQFIECADLVQHGDFFLLLLPLLPLVVFQTSLLTSLEAGHLISSFFDNNASVTLGHLEFPSSQLPPAEVYLRLFIYDEGLNRCLICMQQKLESRLTFSCLWGPVSGGSVHFTLMMDATWEDIGRTRLLIMVFGFCEPELEHDWAKLEKRG